MQYPDLTRYDQEGLGRLLESYRNLAGLHRDKGHFALAKWALGFCTEITVEMNQRVYETAKSEEHQLTIDEALSHARWPSDSDADR